MKWVLRLIGFFIALVLAAVAVVLLLPAERSARIATDQLTKLTGRDVSINGDVGFMLWPVLGVRVEGLEIGGPDWSMAGPMLASESAAIGLDAQSLIAGEILITKLEVDSPIIRLEQTADGRASWIFSDLDAAGDATEASSGQSDATGQAQEASEAPADAGFSNFQIEKLRLTNATLIYAAEGSDAVQVDDVDLALDWPDPNGNAALIGTLNPAGAPVGLTVEIDRFAAFLKGEVQGLRAEIDTSGGTLWFQGRGSIDGAVTGQFAFKTDKTDDFMQSLGLLPIALPSGLGRQIDFATELTFTPDRRLSLRDITADLGGNRLTGAADIKVEDVPQVTAQLDVGTLDLRSALDSSAPQEGTETSRSNSVAPPPRGQAAGWPTTTIDASALAAFNGDISLNADNILIGAFKLGTTRTVLRNDHSRAVFELSEVQAYGGSLIGHVVINNRSGLSVGGRMIVSGAELQPLLADAIGVDRFSGSTNLRFSFLGAGDTIDAIMQSLSGDGSMNTGQGTIQGINLDQLMRGGPIGGGTTLFDSLSGSWAINNGVLRNSDLLLSLSNYQAGGAGQVGLGMQTVDYTFTPVALRANSGQGLAVPVRFTGPWTNISIQPDLEAAIDMQVDAEVDKLEEEAKKRLNEQLGIEQNQGQSLEDAVKDQLLQKLFD
ncbi:MAG: AsmA family protein [Pseudomonadota bacterium]